MIKSRTQAGEGGCTGRAGGGSCGDDLPTPGDVASRLAAAPAPVFRNFRRDEFEILGGRPAMGNVLSSDFHVISALRFRGEMQRIKARVIAGQALAIQSGAGF